MKTFTIENPNTFYYVTSVTYNRVRIFRDERMCGILIAVFAEVRSLFPYKLISYVIMPDHFHAVINPIDGDISKWLLRVRGNSARTIIDQLENDDDGHMLGRLTLESPQKRNHRYAVWQKDPSIVDLHSHKFLV
ncbi:MAG: transposase [Pyrinomonadaceae bacterium]